MLLGRRLRLLQSLKGALLIHFSSYPLSLFTQLMASLIVFYLLPKKKKTLLHFNLIEAKTVCIYLKFFSYSIRLAYVCIRN